MSKVRVLVGTKKGAFILRLTLREGSGRSRGLTPAGWR